MRIQHEGELRPATFGNGTGIPNRIRFYGLSRLVSQEWTLTYSVFEQVAAGENSVKVISIII